MIRSSGARAAIALGLALTFGCEGSPEGIVAERRFSRTRTAEFAVAESGSTVVDTFAGAVTLEQGAAGQVAVVATRWADREEDLESLPVEMVLDGNVVRLTAANPSSLHDVSVDFDLTGPADLSLDARVGVGTVVCRGRPPALWHVDVGVGNVELAIPRDSNVRVDLLASVGRVEVELPVQGSVSGGRVVGTIGSGADGEIVARSAVGNIVLTASR